MGSNILNNDKVTNAVSTIDYAHKEIHAGDHYYYNKLDTIGIQTDKLAIMTPNSPKRVHMLFDIECTGELRVTISEAGDRVLATEGTAFNRDRDSIKTNDATVFESVSGGTTDGTVIFEIRNGTTATNGRSLTPGSRRGNNEVLLKPNTAYVMELETFAAGHRTIFLDWYEHASLA
jgi:hypothetical protein